MEKIPPGSAMECGRASQWWLWSQIEKSLIWSTWLGISPNRPPFLKRASHTHSPYFSGILRWTCGWWLLAGSFNHQLFGWVFLGLVSHNDLKDYTIPSYMGIVIKHYKDPGMNQPVFHLMGFEHCSFTFQVVYVNLLMGILLGLLRISWDKTMRCQGVSFCVSSHGKLRNWTETPNCQQSWVNYTQPYGIHVWYIFLHLPPLKSNIHVGKYTSPVDGMTTELNMKHETPTWTILWFRIIGAGKRWTKRACISPTSYTNTLGIVPIESFHL